MSSALEEWMSNPDQLREPGVDAVYMVRNLMTGDDEETRVADADWDLPEAFKTTIQILGAMDEYDLACELFILFRLQGKTEAELEALVERFLVVEAELDAESQANSPAEDYDYEPEYTKEELMSKILEILSIP